MNELSTATANQFTENGKKGSWEIRTNKGKVLYVLTEDFTDKQTFSILHLLREVENKSFNEGIQHQRHTLGPKRIKDLENIVLKLKDENKVLLKENEKIGNALDKAILSEN